MVGNIPNFNKYDVVRCFFAIEKDTSRQSLIDTLGLGEGTVRSLLDVLKDKKLIESTRQGHSLTNKGFKLMRKIEEKMIVPEGITTAYYENKEQAFVIIKNNKKEITIEQRDIAIKNRADAVLILQFDGKRLSAPNCEPGFDDLQGMLNFKKDDLLILCFAEEKRDAENACIAVSEQFYSEFTENFK